MRRRHSSNSGIPIFDTKPLTIDSDLGSKSDSISQGSPLISRLPSLKPQASRQKLSLSTRKCVSSSVTPISSPIIPKNTNNNLHHQIPSNKFSNEVIESSARLISEIDVTLSQLSRQYYTDNNNFVEVLYTPANEDDITPTSQRNNNYISHVSNTTTAESCDCKMLNKLKFKKPQTITASSEDYNSSIATPKMSAKQSHIPNSYRESAKQKSLQSRPTKLQFTNESNKNNESNEQVMINSSYKSYRSSTGKKSKSSTINRIKSQDNALNPNATYTETWIYNSRLPIVAQDQTSHTNNLIQYIAKNNDCIQNCPKVYYPLYQTSSSANSELFQKAIFNQHRHSSKAAVPNEIMATQKYIQKLPMPSKKVKNNKDELNANRDSGISSSSCSKESWADLVSETKVLNNNNNNNNNMNTSTSYNNNSSSSNYNNNTMPSNLPQPPPRISSLVQGSQNASDKCPTLTNHSTLGKDYLTSSSETNKPASKADRRKARELFASVKQRDEQRMRLIKDEDPKVNVTESKSNLKEVPHPVEDIKPKLKEVGKDEVVETPNSDLESGIVEGYCSDMDNLKNSGYCSDNSGYMSEGGLGLYAQKMQQRFREGLLAVQESLKLTSNNKIANRKFENVVRDDLSSTSSEEIEDYLKELSSRLVYPPMSEISEPRQNSDVFNQKRNSVSRSLLNDLQNPQVQLKNRLYQERLQKYACDVEPAADFDITSSCSMDLLTGKAVSDVGSEEETSEFKDYFGNHRRVSDFQGSSTKYNYGSSVIKQPIHPLESNSKNRSIGSNKIRPSGCEILEAAGPTPATFEDDADLRAQESGNNHYRAMSLPGRQKRTNAWEVDATSLSRMETGHMYPLPQPPANNTNIYYDVPVCKGRPNRYSGSSTPSLMNIRLPYATLSQGVKSSMSTCSLGKKDDGSEDVYDGLGSRLSLLSTSSYRSLNEERQATEIRKLRRELEMAQQKVRTLSGQLSNNGNLVTAFENSLQSMSMRLQKFAASSESKENELNELKNTIESLKKQASSSPSHIDPNPGKIYSASSLTSLISSSNSSEKRSEGSNKKSSWLKNSFGRAFRKKSSKDDGSTESINDIHQKQSDIGNSIVQSMTESESLHALRKELEEKDARLTDVQLDALSRSHQLEQLRDLLTKMRYEMSSLKADNNRLQSLMTMSNAGVSSQSLEQSVNSDSLEQLDQTSSLKNMPKIKDLNTKPKFDFLNALVKEDDSTQALVVYVILNNKSKFSSSQLNSSPTSEKVNIPIGRVGITSMTSWSDLENNLRRLVKEYMSAIDSFSSLGLNGESIARYRINDDTFISVCNTGSMRPLTSPLASCSSKSSSRISLELKNYAYSNSIDDMVFDCLIPKTILQRYFGLLLEHKRVILCGPSGTGKTYLAYKLAENIACRHNRDPATSVLIFNVDHKSTKELRSYMVTLTEQLLKSDPLNDSNMSSIPSLPLVIILDNLHHVSSFSEIFNSFLSIQHTRSPFVIGTMSQTNSSNTKNLQLHHNFRWVLCTNHMEPVKGYLGRYLRRQFLKHQLETGLSNDHLYHVIEWIYIVWQHINKFLESYSSADVTIGPRLFLNCPMSVDNAKAWFIDLWNYSIVPYIIEAVREGLTVHGRKQATWDDPTDWIIRSWPWNDLNSSLPISNNPIDPSNLIRLRPEDVGFDSYQLITAPSDHIGPYSINSHLGIESLNSGRLSATYDRRVRHGDKPDSNEPLMNMLLRMQEKNLRKS